MSGTKTRKRDRFKRGIRDFFKPSGASKDQLSKETEGKDTGNSQIDPSIATSSSASGLIPRHLATAPSTHLATTFGSSTEAQSLDASENESFASNSPSQLIQTPVATIEDTEISQVSKEQANQHTPKAPSVVKAKSLWIEASKSNRLDDRERETLQVIDFQADALESVSKARYCAEEVLRVKKEKYPKVQKLIKWMDRFKEVGDIIVQYDPVHAALPWAGVRLLLKLCVDRQKTLDTIVDGLDNIAGLINRCTRYELLYLREDSDDAKDLKNSMLKLYIAVLQFLARAIDKSKENGLQAIFTMENIAEHLQGIDSLEKAVKRDVDDAHAKSTRDDLQDMLTLLKNIDNIMSDIQPQLKSIQHWLEDSDKSSILQWISDIPYTSHHKRISEERLEGTGNWLFEREEYTAWISSSDSKLLLLRGIPGAGKTYIASKVIDSPHRAGASELKLVYFYCNRAEENRQEPESILSAIIQQLAQSGSDDNKLPKLIVDEYRGRQKQGQLVSRLSFSDSQKLLVQLTNIYPQTLICIDALDEVAESKRIPLLKALKHVMEQSEKVVKIFATTRMNPEIVAQFKIFPRIELQPDDNVNDINQFVETRVNSAIDDGELLCGNVSDELKAEICTVLCERSKGMFQLAALQITFLCQKRFTEGHVRRSLRSLPEKLEAMYDKTYESITSQESNASRLALNAFHWIQYSYEPLSTKTLLDAITVEVGRLGEILPKDPINADSLLKLCQNLLVLDKSLNVFRFAHLSVQEYLESRPELNKASSHTKIAKVCFSLLRSPATWGSYAESKIEEGEYMNRHLLSYSVVFWPWHFSHCVDENGRQTLLDLWDAFISENYQQWLNYHRLWVYSYWSYDNFWRRIYHFQKGADNVLTLFCTFGLSRMFQSAFELTRHDTKVDLGSLLLVSSECGDLDIASFLIDNGADILTIDRMGRSSLHLASWMGHCDVIRLLIDNGADVSLTDNNGRTPLHQALNEEIARLLIDKGADVSVANNSGRTPLHEVWNEEMARLLIDKGADVSLTDNDGRTPLHNAQNEEIARLLIDKGADVSVADNSGRTPLHQALNEEIARLLIDKGADVSLTNNNGRTPLHEARNEEIARLLIDKGADVRELEMT